MITKGNYYFYHTKRYKTNELIFYFAYIIYLWVSMLGTCYLGDVLGITSDIINTTKHIVALLLACSILINAKFSRKLAFIIIGIVVTSVLVYWNMGAFNPILAILFLLGARRCNPRRICKVHFYCILCTITIIFLSAILGFVDNYVFYRDDAARYCMGFRNATWFGYVFYLFVDYCWIKLRYENSKLKRSEGIIIIILAICAYILSKSRLELISTFILLIAINYSDKIMKHKAIKWILVFSFAGMVLLSFVTTYMYMIGTPIANSLDRLLDHRLQLNSVGYSRYGITLFGEFVTMQGISQTTAENAWSYFYIDNFYVSYIIQYGIIWMTLVLLFLTLINVKLAKENSITLIFMALVALQGFIIPTMMDFISSCTILFAFNEMWILRNRTKHISITMNCALLESKGDHLVVHIS